MSTPPKNTPSTTPPKGTSAPVEKDPKKRDRRKRRLVYISIIALLLILNAVLFLSNWQNTQEKEKAQKRAEEAERLMEKAQLNYDRAIEEMALYKADMVGKDTLLSAQERELAELKDQIDQLLRSKNVSDRNLGQARALLSQIQKEKNIYLTQIDSLSAITKKLVSENKILGEQLKEEKKETKMLKKENVELSKKVESVSIPNVSNIEGTGIRMHPKKGQEIETNKAKKATKLKILFDIGKNKVADPGKKRIHVIIKGPGGIMYDQAQGSGSFTDAETGEEKKYTYNTEIDYQNQSQTVTVYWKPEGMLSSGLYIVEIYYQMYPVGQGEFVLK